MPKYKLFTIRKDGSIGSLFINKKQKIILNDWMDAGCYSTKGFATRAGWHVMDKPIAPHLSISGSAWFEVEIEDFETIMYPSSQGGKWYLAKKLKVIGKYEGECVNFERKKKVEIVVDKSKNLNIL